MKIILIILFSLLVIIQNHNLRILNNSYVEKENCSSQWVKITEKQCSYPDGTKIEASTKENCVGSNTWKCSNANYTTKEDCEKYNWVKGKCYKKSTDNYDYFLSNYTDKESCEEKKVDWTMQYCSFHTFKGAVYDKVKTDNDEYNQTKHFTTVCDTLGGNTSSFNDDTCYFDKGSKLNKYFCSILYDNPGVDEECEGAMESEQCENLGGIEYGRCSSDNIYGEVKDKCLKISQNKWETGENESFCSGDVDILTEDLCLAKNNGKWQKVYGNWTAEYGECISSKQYLSLKIILMIFAFIFTI